MTPALLVLATELMQYHQEMVGAPLSSLQMLLVLWSITIARGIALPMMQQRGMLFALSEPLCYFAECKSAQDVCRH